MRLILEENSFKFTERHYVQTHGIAMGTKMAVAFSVMYMADLEERLLAASPFKPTVCKRFIDDVFTLWDISTTEVQGFVDFANTFHPTIKFTSSDNNTPSDPKFLYSPILNPCHFLVIFFHRNIPCLISVIFFLLKNIGFSPQFYSIFFDIKKMTK